MEVIGRVESGTETESNAGRLYGYRRSKMSGTNFPAVAEDVLSGFLLLANPKYLHPCRQYRGCMDDIQEVLVSRERTGVRSDRRRVAIYMVKEGLNKLQNSFSRHSGTGLRHTSTGSGQNQVKTIIYWMLVFTSMTIMILNQSFHNIFYSFYAMLIIF